MDSEKGKLFDYLCIVLIAFLALSSVIHWNDLYPNFVDSYYHLAVIRAFTESGGVVLHDYWEFAPSGRPHLYGPTTHIIGFILNSSGIDIYRTGQFMSWFTYPLSFILMWLWLREVSGSRGAFFSLALLAGPDAWYFNQTAHWGNAIALTLAPAAFLAFHKHRYVASAVLSAMACYAHGSGFVVPATLFLYGIHRPKLFFKSLMVALSSLLMYLPWAIHVYAHRNLIVVFQRGRDSFLQLQDFQFYIILIPLALAGIIIAYKQRGNTLILSSFLIAFLVMFPMGYAHRFWRFNSIMPYAALGGLALTAGLEWLIKRFDLLRWEIPVSLAILLIGMNINPVITSTGAAMQKPPHNRVANEPGRDFKPKPAVRFPRTAIAVMLGEGQMRGSPDMGRADMDTLLNLIEEHTNPEDIIGGAIDPMKSCMVTSLTGRRSSNGMLSEVRSEYFEPGIENINIFVFDENIPENMEMTKPPAQRQNNSLARMRPPVPASFQFIDERNGITLYRNPTAEVHKLELPSPVLGLMHIIVLSFGVSGLIIVDAVRSRFNRRLFFILTAVTGIFVVMAITPLGVKAMQELANPPGKPAWMPQDGPHGRPPLGIEPFMGNVPVEIARKHKYLMSLTEKEFSKGRKPDWFLPRETALKIHELLQQGHFKEAETLIDKALSIYDSVE